MPSPADIAIGAFRWIEYVGLLTAVGMFVIRRLAANQPRIGWARPPLHLALVAALAGGLAVVSAEAWAASGSGALTFLLGGPAGWVRVARVAAEALALAFCLRGVRFVAPVAVVAAGAIAFAGHASAARVMAGGIFIDALHVLAAGMWGGGILALASLQPPGGWEGESARALLGRFGRVAAIAFALTALTGVLRATEELRDVRDLWLTSYGVVLSLKAAGVLVMVALSVLVSRRGLRLGRAEAVLALVVLALTALLAAYPLTPAGA
ncbi:MAG TPA: hypothetical protein VGK42_05180 [Candidatus Dormibacteraeota bacterium]